MKNTKNLLITGVALTIALFASVQMTAVNPNLSESDRTLVLRQIETNKDKVKKLYNEPRNPYKNYLLASAQARVDAYETIYDGDKRLNQYNVTKMIDNDPRVQEALAAAGPERSASDITRK